MSDATKRWLPVPVWAAVFMVAAWGIPSVAAHYNDKLDNYVERSELMHKLGMVRANFGQLEPYTVDVKVWPQSATVAALGSDGVCRGSVTDPNMPCTQQYVAVAMLTDGSVWCTDGAYNNEPADTADRITMEPWVLPECYDAAALLDTVVVQDTTMRAVRLQWANQSGAQRLIIVGPDTTRLPYDSVRYQLRIRSTDLVMLDSTFADTSFIWQNGTFGQQYFAQGTACGWLGGTISCAPPGQELQILFPYPRVESTTIVPMLLLADTVEVP